MTPFHLANFRYFAHKPLEAFFSVLAIGLGVAVVTAVDLSNQSALRAFEISERALSGSATHAIVSQSDRDGGFIDENLYVELRVEHGFKHMAPTIVGSGLIEHGRTVSLAGVDPLASLDHGGPASGGDMEYASVIMTNPNTVLMTPATARQLGLASGDLLQVAVGEKTYSLSVEGMISAQPAVLTGLENTLIMDIATAQSVLDRVGLLSRIDLQLDKVEHQRLLSVLPPGVVVVTSGSRSYALARMTRAFQINLTALSLLALVIAAFLIYNSQTLSVLKRREQLAVWRTLGVTRGTIMARVLFEGLMFGAVGVLLGWVLGIGLSQVLLDLVTQTINDLYFQLQVSSVVIDYFSLAKAGALGVGAALVSCAIPAREAARTRPSLVMRRSAAEQSAGEFRRRGRLIGAGLLGIAALVLGLSEYSLWAGFVGLFFIVLGFAFLAPEGFLLLGRVLPPVFRSMFGWLGAWSIRNMLAAMSRTQIAVTALAIALAATIGVSIMISSFRTTVEHWLHNYLRADVYISQPASDGSGIEPALAARLRSDPRVLSLSTGRWVRLRHGDDSVRLFVLDVDQRGFENFQLKEEAGPDPWRDFFGAGGVLVSEPFAYRYRLSAGDDIELPSDSGNRIFSVAGIYYDYGSDRGTVAMHRATYDRYWADPVFVSMAVYLQESAAKDGFVEDLNSRMLADTGLLARSNSRLKQISLQIFDRTFTVTEVLRLLTIAVACIGVFGAMIAIQLERSGEFAILRAMGLTRLELSGAMMMEGGVIGFVSAVLAIPLGTALAAVLVFVINKRSFGWSMSFELPWEQIVATLLFGTVAGVLAAVYPAWRADRIGTTDRLRNE